MDPNNNSTSSKISLNDNPEQIIDTIKPVIDKKVNEFREFIEVEVLRIIKDLADKGQTDEKKIQEIAQIVLDTIKPGMNLDELYRQATKLDDKHPELAPLVFKIMKQYEERYEKEAVKNVTHFVREGKYDEAQELVKKVLQFKIVN